ncbi:MAG: hydroxypyruvate isomerase family protein [Planctomycetota bacterium]|jgi:hydroxypyruvate isomerase
MKRREFLGSGLAGLAVGAAAAGQDDAAAPRPFTLKYAPHFGMFRHLAGEDPIDQLRFMAEQGFTALEDNGMRGRPAEVQEKIAREMERLGMTMGVFVAHAEFGDVTFATGRREATGRILADIRASIETAKRVNARWCTVVPGAYHKRLEWDYQTANVIDNLRRCCELCEPEGLVMVLEPLNPYRDHPGLFLTKIPQAAMICRAVNSPSCMILDDLYHQQITEGNLIPNIDGAWEQIAYFQVGDHPGRCEPTTGEINYATIFRHLHRKGFEGIVGMEHGVSGRGADGERAVIEAYRAVDPEG